LLVLGGRLPKDNPETADAIFEIFSGNAIVMNLAYMD